MLVFRVSVSIGNRTEAPLSSSFALQVQVFWETPYNVVVEHPNPRAFMARTLKHGQNPWALDM